MVIGQQARPPGLRMTAFGDIAGLIWRRPILYCDGWPCLNEMAFSASQYGALIRLSWIKQLLLINLVLIEVKEVPGQNSRYGSTTAQSSFGGECP
jgi:hypothetical protein